MQSLTTYVRHAAASYPKTLPITDVGLPRGVRAPAAGLVCLFGKTAIPELARRRLAAEAVRKTVTTIRIVVDADDSARDFALPSHLATAEFLQLANMSGETLAVIIERMERQARKTRARFEDPIRGGVFATRQLDLLTAVFADPLFGRLQLVTTRVPMPDAALGWTTVAVLFSAEKIVEIEARRYSAADILLPAKLPLTRAEFEAALPAAGANAAAP